MTRYLRLRAVRVGFGVVAVASVGYALFRTWDDSQGQVLPDPTTIGLASVVLVSSLIGGGLSWYTLFGPEAPRRLMADFYLAQLGKYIPGGGIWQAAGQVGLSASRGYSATRVSSNLALHAVILLASALCLGGFLVFATDLPLWLRIVSGVGLAAPLILHRSWMAILLRWVGGWLRLDTEQTAPPRQRTIVRSWLWSLLPTTGFSVAYGLMVHSLEPSVGVWRGAIAFAMAWAIGFVLVPFPAGLGAREATLVVLVGGSTAVIIAASLALRLIAIGGDLILASVTRRLWTPRISS
jgi:hypothetical protein